MNKILSAEEIRVILGTPENIPQMRHFILDLAVRGKLMPQNSKDESAAKLLTKIAAEKKKLVRAGKIKPSAVLPPIADSEIPFAIPNGWEWMRLGNIGEWGSGTTPPREVSEYYNGNITWLKSGELNDTVNLKGSNEKITAAALEKFSFRKNKIGDVLFAMYGATIGKTAILGEPAVTNQAVCGCTPYNGVLNDYLFLFLIAERDRFHRKSEGAAQPNISKHKAIRFYFPLPPFAEQKRIVAKVNQLMACCDKLEEAQKIEEGCRERFLDSVLQELTDTSKSFVKSADFALSHFSRLTLRAKDIKIWRKSILDLVVRGKLVPQNSKDESATKLLTKIVEEKKKLVKAGKIKAVRRSAPDCGK